MLLQMASFHSFLWLSSIPISDTVSLSSLLLMDIQSVSMSQLLEIVVQWTLGCMLLFRLEFYPDACPCMGLLWSSGDSVFSFLRNLHTVFHSDDIYIPTNSVGWFLFLHILSSICYLYIDFLMMAVLIGVRWYLVIVLICIYLIISDIEHLFMCLLAIILLRLLWSNVCLDLLLIFWLGCLGCFC